ncbi:MAG: helix-turn-helix domain-containing protein [Candidatus Paceibacterota bacterium]
MDSAEKNIREALDLSAYEAKVYLAGLNFEQATLTELSRVAGIPRTAAYPPLKHLLDRGLLSSVKKGKRVYYRSLEPRHLTSLLERKKLQLEETVQSLSQRITVPANDVSVQYFPGVNGVKVAGEIFLSASKGKLWKTFENPLLVASKGGEQGLDRYIERRVEKGIRARVIAPSDVDSEWVDKHLEQDERELRETVLVSPAEYPIDTSIAIEEEMILMIDARAVPFAVLIQNTGLARTLSSVHDMVWDRYKI